MVNTLVQASIMTDERTAGSMLLAVAGEKLSVEWLEWDPQVIRNEVDAAFGISIPDRNFNKLMAAVNILTSDEYWKSLSDFVVLNNALYAGVINLDVVDIATMDEISVGLSESLLIYPTDPLTSFSRPIIDYINGMRSVERFSIPPTVVRLMFGDLCPPWYEDFMVLSEDPQLYAAAYSQALDKVAAVDDEVLGRLKLSVAQAVSAGMSETAEYVSKLISILSEQNNGIRPLYTLDKAILAEAT